MNSVQRHIPTGHFDVAVTTVASDFTPFQVLPANCLAHEGASQPDPDIAALYVMGMTVLRSDGGGCQEGSTCNQSASRGANNKARKTFHRGIASGTNIALAGPRLHPSAGGFR